MQLDVTALNNTGDKSFSASFVANCECKDKSEGAYSATPYISLREAIFCKLCGNMATFKFNLKEHNLLSHVENVFFTNKL